MEWIDDVMEWRQKVGNKVGIDVLSLVSVLCTCTKGVELTIRG